MMWMANSMTSRNDQETQTNSNIPKVPRRPRITPRKLTLLPIHMSLGSPGQAAPVDIEQQNIFIIPSYL